MFQELGQELQRSFLLTILYSVDDEFWTWLDTYVNEGIGKDIESTQVGQPSLPDEFQRLMDLASSDLAKKMEEFMKRMTAAHEFFRQCGGSKGIHHGLDQTLVNLICVSTCLSCHNPSVCPLGLLCNDVLFCVAVFSSQ